MKTSTYAMSVLLAVPLALVGCDNGSAEGSGTTEDPSTTTGDMTTSADSTGPLPPSCNEEQPIPEPPMDCAGVDGVLSDNLFIDEENPDISVLEGIARIEGSFRINRMPFTDLNFLTCLREVTGDITIFGNEALTDVSGLHNIELVGTDFVFSENNAITDFHGLPNLIKIDRNLILKNNAALTTITGFHSLVGIEGNLTIQFNDVLEDVNGLGGLQLVGETLAITNNPALCLSSVDCVGDGIVQPATPPPEWSSQANNEGC